MRTNLERQRLGEDAGILLETLFDVIYRMPEHTFATNLQLCAVLRSVLSYSQPVLTTYLLYVGQLKNTPLYRITDLLIEVRTQIDEFASSVGREEFAKLLRRGIRARQAKAERTERSVVVGNKGSGGGGATKLAENGSQPVEKLQGTPRSEIRITHRAVAERHAKGKAAASKSSVGKAGPTSMAEECSSPSSRRNNVAYAAIVFSQLCQLMAAFALQHNPAMLQKEHYPFGDGAGKTRTPR